MKKDGQRARRAQAGRERRVRACHLGGGLLETVSDQRHLVTGPGRYEGDRRDGRRRGVDQVGQLLARDPQPIGDRSHRIADDQGIGVVVEKDRQPRAEGGELAAPPVRGERGDRLHDPARAAAASHQTNHAAQHQAEDGDGRVAGVGEGRRDVRIDGAQQSGERIEPGDEERAEPNTGKERDKDLVGDEGERDRQQWREEAEPAWQHESAELSAGRADGDAQRHVGPSPDHETGDLHARAGLRCPLSQDLSVAGPRHLERHGARRGWRFESDREGDLGQGGLGAAHMNLRATLDSRRGWRSVRTEEQQRGRYQSAHDRGVS